MLLTGDYHTHTIYSHGKGTVLQNAERAKEIGLKEIAITDHGFEQMAFGLRHERMPQLIADCREASEKTGLNVYVGIEANLCDENGRTDLREEDYKDFDIYLMGIHRFVKFTHFRDFWNMLALNSLYTTFRLHASKSLIRYNTNAYIRSIEKYPIDAITHMNFLSYYYVEEEAKAAMDHWTYIELNAKKTHLTDEELVKVRDTGVRFIVDSDAHSVDRIGDTALVDKLLERVEIPKDRIDNIEGRTPSFRFAEYKKRHL